MFIPLFTLCLSGAVDSVSQKQLSSCRRWTRRTEATDITSDLDLDPFSHSSHEYSNISKERDGGGDWRGFLEGLDFIFVQQPGTTFSHSYLPVCRLLMMMMIVIISHDRCNGGRCSEGACTCNGKCCIQVKLQGIRY